MVHTNNVISDFQIPGIADASNIEFNPARNVILILSKPSESMSEVNAIRVR